MARNKEREKKEFILAKRKKVGPSITNAPFWVSRRANKRIWNKRQKRNWRETSLGKEYEKYKRKKKKTVKGRKHYKKGRKYRR